MDDNFPMQQSEKKPQPRGQLAALLQNRGWEDYAAPEPDFSRSSSAPPTNLQLNNPNLFDFEEEERPGIDPRLPRPAYSPGPNWNLWAPPQNSTASPNARQDFAGKEMNGFFTPSPVQPGVRSSSPWSTPLRANIDSPLRQSNSNHDKMKFLSSSGTYAKPMKPAGFVDQMPHESPLEDELRMRALLNAALDSKDPIQRAVSTPPSRLQFGIPNLTTEELELSFNQMHTNDSMQYSGLHTVATSTFPVLGSASKPRTRTGNFFDTESDLPHRPASAQGRFGTTNHPPGFGDINHGLDATMNQALATLIASGNLSATQIQQIESQLRGNTGSPVPQWQDKGRQFSREASPRKDKNRDRSPVRVKDGRKSPVSNSEGSPTGRSALLEEFRNNKTKKFELKDIVGSIVEFSSDQHGSRFIQQKLENATVEEKKMVFDEIIPYCLQLTTDVFGNYVIQKFFEYGSPVQKENLAKQMEGHVLHLSLQMYGCRVVQKALEYVLLDQQIKLIEELDGNILKCVKDQNGNHVIQKAVERIDADKIQFIIAAFHGQVYSLATHPYGCRVIQRIFEHCSEKETIPLHDELRQYALNLIQDQYGNYVIQHIVEKGRPSDKLFVIEQVKGHVLNMSKHKFASNVVEKCVIHGSSEDKQQIIDEVLTVKSDGTTPLYIMMKDQFANYVVQKLLDVANEEQRRLLIQKIRPQLSNLKKFTYGKHLISKVEKLITLYNIS